ncbi:MAG: hypothetical protein R2743_03690 [Ilumatobacteraceae bacterium]
MVLLVTGGVPQTMHRAVFAELVPAMLGRHVAPDLVPDDARLVIADRYVGSFSSPLLDLDVARWSSVTVSPSSPVDTVLALTLRPAGGEPVGPLPLRPVDDRVFLTELDGRPYSVAFELGSHGQSVAVLAGLRRLVRVR